MTGLNDFEVQIIKISLSILLWHMGYIHYKQDFWDFQLQMLTIISDFSLSEFQAEVGQDTSKCL